MMKKLHNVATRKPRDATGKKKNTLSRNLKEKTLSPDRQKNEAFCALGSWVFTSSLQNSNVANYWGSAAMSSFFLFPGTDLTGLKPAYKF